MAQSFIVRLIERAEARLLEHARFEAQPYPTENDLEIWLEDARGNKTLVTPEFAKTVPIVELKSRRAGSETIDTPGLQPGEGGAAPTPALQTT